MTCPMLCRRAAVADTVSDLAARVRAEDTLGQFLRFVLVGGTSTLFYAVLFTALGRLGYLPAHVLSTVASTVLANELHRRLTFRAEERVGWLAAQAEAGGISVLALVATSAALAWLNVTAADAGVLVQIALVVSITAIIGLMRFAALRWIFRPRSAARHA